ncbi:hypothetical protein MOV76_32130 [Rhizobium sp. PRIMUS64]|uniref:hypothetical protein n=1 Tax=Rhizobium sp. PRIMUS64 TaxID=2908925 RepID=UPI001FF3842A|nr:hypothetical protein [Rhizobium sp. PRIMUS64]MCJ9696221.1 hypothetical protein [Rhizobium sp. PRIMUS64]
MTETIADDELYCLTSGLVCCSVCAPADWTKEKIEQETNRKNPTGIESRWEISADENFATGQKNGCDCEQGAGRRHWLMNC